MKNIFGWLCLATILLSSNIALAADDVEKCLSTHRIDHTEILDGQTILFHMIGKKVYVNKLPRRCPGLSFHKAFSYKVHQNRLCNTDIIRVYQGDYFGAACGLGKFEPYDVEAAKAAKAAKAAEAAEEEDS